MVKPPFIEITCPVCSKPVKTLERYPRSLCSQCSARVTDRSGRPVVFYDKHLRMEHGRCRAMLEFAHALEALGLPPSLLASSSCCRVVLGSLTGENWQRLREIAFAGPAHILLVDCIAPLNKF